MYTYAHVSIVYYYIKVDMLPTDKLPLLLMKKVHKHNMQVCIIIFLVNGQQVTRVIDDKDTDAQGI